MSAITPESFSKRSFVYRQLSAASFTEVAGAAQAADLKNGRNQAMQAGLLDLSVLPRTGFRGLNAAAHLQAAGLPVPAKPNQASVADSGELVLRLSQKEFWVLGNLADEGARIDSLNQQPLPDSNCYPLYCQDSHAWLTLTGAHLPAIMAKVCGVDLREEAFPLGSIAQTSAARINVVIVNHQINGLPCFTVLCDSAAAEYLWECLLDAMGEFGGEVIGSGALS
ncbi:MAG: sarcosine oxidase subunit gamma [Marinobacterium sp.]|nr:sarcosine oxidase subunit gamma [Marinobacterium sp.]